MKARDMNSSSRFLLICAASLAGATASSALGCETIKSQDQELNKCLSVGDAQQGFMWAIFQCYSDVLSKIDKDLNQEYLHVRQNRSHSDLSRLRDSERRWIIKRDQTCKRAS